MAFQIIMRLISVVQNLTELVFYQLPAQIDKWWEQKNQGFPAFEETVQKMEAMFEPVVVQSGIFRKLNTGNFQAGVSVERRFHYLDPDITFSWHNGETYVIGGAGTLVKDDGSTILYLLDINSQVKEGDGVTFKSGKTEYTTVFKSIPTTDEFVIHEK